MKMEIPLTKGFAAIVDDEDYAWAIEHRWVYAGNGRGTHYAGRWVYEGGKRRHVRLHREIVQRAGKAAEEFEVDHINKNGLDNRRENLRVVTRRENLMNRRSYCNNKSGLKGVYWVAHCRKWEASLTVNGKKEYYGLHSSKEAAAELIIRRQREIHENQNK